MTELEAELLKEKLKNDKLLVKSKFVSTTKPSPIFVSTLFVSQTTTKQFKS
jgi:hypothetical protein